jgi:hypothetical protein
MVRNAQKSQGARSGLYGRCSNEVPPIYFFQAEHRTQNSDLAPCNFWTFPTMKREL